LTLEVAGVPGTPGVLVPADFARPIIEAMQSQSQSLRVRENFLISHVLAAWVDQPPGYEWPVR